MSTADWLDIAAYVLYVSGCVIGFAVSVRCAIRHETHTNAFISLALGFLVVACWSYFAIFL